VEVLTLARHEHDQDYFAGGNYELNLSFDSLRDKQWAQVAQVVWQYPALVGPLATRFIPGKSADSRAEVQVPAPTATLTQHGQLKLPGNRIIGCEVLMTRSLFECVSVLIPLGMFQGLTGGLGMRHQNPDLQELDDLLIDLALQVYDGVAFQIAALGHERGCQLLAELRGDGEIRHSFLVAGNFLAQDDVLRAIEPDLVPYKEVRPNLRWLGPQI
ncbi:MAG TPA: hypothetical protein VMT34_03705, partial [Aggregatilineales bacterium]|nr:hypothetical protein [Aggregatilineales bacterium]